MSPQDARAAIALTYGMVAMVDNRVGMLLAALERPGLAANTIVGFTSDHGDYMGELYDLENDPDEERNLWSDPASRPLRADMTEQLARRMLALRDDCPRPPQAA